MALVAVSFLSVTLGLSLASAGDADADVKTLVMNLKAQRDVEPALAQSLTSIVVNELSSDDTRIVMSSADIEAALNFEANKQALGCDDTSCLSEIASAMDADTVVTGTIDRLGETYVVTVTELNAQTVRPIARAQGTSPLDEAALLKLVTSLVEEVVAKSRGKVTLYGTVEIRTVPSGQPAFLDDKDLGLTPLEVPLPVGTHALTVGSADAGTVRFDAVVKRKKTTVADIRLREVPPPTAAEQAAYDDALTWGPWALAAKLLAGFPLCICFTVPSGFSAVIIATFAGQLISPSSPESATEQYVSSYWSGIAAYSALFIVSAVLAGGGLGLVGWGVADVFTDVEAPTGGPMRHRVMLSGPSGDETLTFPVDDVMAH